MLTILGEQDLVHGGVPRRSFLRIGALGLGGASLPQILRADAAAGRRNSQKAIIMVVLPGGPPHQDMYDMKPDAPSEIRGEFSPIETNVPGIQITELMPRIASIMDKCAIIRSLHGGLNDHNVHQCLTGWETHPPQGDSRGVRGYPDGGWPSIGAVASKFLGGRDPSVPAFVSLSPPNAESTTRASLNQSGFLGLAHQGFEPTRRQRFDVVYRSGQTGAKLASQREDGADIILKGISLERLRDRRRLLETLDRFRRDTDASGTMYGMDDINQQAFSILSSSKVAQALDLSREDPRVRDRYGISAARVPVNGGPKLLEQFLLARRLVEAGARCVTLAFSQWPLERESRGGHNWDWHFDNFRKARITLPLLDQGLSALIEDLDSRDMLDDVSVVAWGEFGRTPRINGSAGRDHWPQLSGCLLAGGGMRTGQAIGTSNRFAEVPKDRPVHYREVFATLYHQLGIPQVRETLNDRGGRPFYVVDQDPIGELI